LGLPKIAGTTFFNLHLEEPNMTTKNKLNSLGNQLTGLKKHSVDALTESALKTHMVPSNITHEHLHGSASTEMVHTHTIDILRSSLLITEDRNRAVDLTSAGGDSSLPRRRRRWPVDCGQFTTWTAEQTPDTPTQHGTALGKKEVEAIYGTVSNDATLAKHKASAGGHAEESTYFENSRVTLGDASFNDIGRPGIWVDDQTLDTAFYALESLFRCEDHEIALFNMGFALATITIRE
jgi:hypothetical protein